MKQIIECGDMYLAIFNESNNWLLTANRDEAERFTADDEEKCKAICLRPSTITLHITNLCNMNCKYCFAGAGIDHAIVMDMEIVQRVADIISELKTTTVCIDFHGGEPLTQKQLIREIVDYFEQHVKEKKKVYYVQTNATLIDDATASFLKEHNFIVGVSLDGNRETNDGYRIMANGEGSWSRIIKGIEVLKKWKVPFSCLAVVTNPSAMLEDYEFFVANGIYDIQFMPVMPQGRAQKESICIKDWKEYADKEIQVFHRVLDDRKMGKPVIHSSSFVLMKKIMMNKDDNICMRRPCGAGQDILVIDEGGDIFPCDSLSGIENQDHTRLGNVKEYGHLNEIAQGEEYQRYVTLIQNSPEKCQTCFCKSICCGGCRSDVYNAFGRWDKETPLCEYYQYVIKEYFKVLHERKEDVIKYLRGRV